MIRVENLLFVMFYSRTERSHVQFCFIKSGVFPLFYNVLLQTSVMLYTRNVKPTPLTVRFELSIDVLETRTHNRDTFILIDVLYQSYAQRERVDGECATVRAYE